MSESKPEVAHVDDFRQRLAETQAEGRLSLYLFRCTAEAVAARLDRLEQRLTHCHDWYAVRWERLRKLIHDDARHIEDEACDVMANGATTPDDPPTYAQRLAEKDHLIAAARKDHRTALKDVENLRRMVDGLTARVAAQSELLGKRAEGNADA